MVKPRRIQIRISERLYTELIRQSLLSEISISELIRLKILGKKICKGVDEDD